jgi:subtilisin family serine protease
MSLCQRPATMSEAHPPRRPSGWLLAAAWAAGLGTGPAALAAAPLPAAAIERLSAGEATELLVEFESADIDAATRAGPSGSDRDRLADRAARLAARREAVEREAGPSDWSRLHDYRHLPFAFRRFVSRQSAERYADHPAVRAIYPNDALQPGLAQALPLIGQPPAATAGLGGDGQTIAVIDGAVDIARPEFGSCTAPGQPAGCRIVAALAFGSGASSTTHGSNVAATALAVAPAARIAALDAFSGGSAFTADVLQAIDWSIDNQAALGIAAINMSLGDTVRYTAPCTTGNAYLTPVANARAAGIAVVASSGNSAFADGMAKPACTPGVLSVGAVYDANVGGLSWGSSLCTDLTTAADKVTCFSNSASFLTLLAPGALITAGGSTQGGTSQAAPQVAGAAAVLRAAFPAESLGAIETRLVASGKPVTDPRNGIVKPRLDLAKAAAPANDAFAAAPVLAGSGGSVTGSNRLATAEAGEPAHAALGGGRSVWWRWSAPAAGQVRLDTAGSGFAAALAAYRGATVATLTRVGRDDDPGNPPGTVLFQAQAGLEYRIAVDGRNGGSGDAIIGWTLDAGAQANLVVAITGAATGPLATSHLLTVSNLGPAFATGTLLTITLPAGTATLTVPPECQPAAAGLACALGTLAAGESRTLGIDLVWPAGSTGASLAASVGSELPDPSSADNAQTLALSLEEGADADVPVAPWWLLGFGAALAGAVVGRSRRA